MTTKNISKFTASLLAKTLRERRISRGETLISIEISTGINRGQLSRFESGKFKFLSKNLQILCNHLEVDAYGTESPSLLGERFECFANSSPHNLSLAQELINFLEKLKDGRSTE